MQYLQLSLPVSEHEFEKVQALLERSHPLSITTGDAEDQPILEPKPGETPLWQNLILTALFPENKNREKIENRLRFYLGEERMQTLKWEILPEQDWERAWLKDYKPLQFGNTLWVGPHDFIPPSDIKAALFLDPGLAFGTGTHPTTFLCLGWLAEQDLKDKTLLDFGCGSGILALAALKLGAKRIIGTDIDPQALDASRDNAKRNQIDEKDCDWILTDATHHQDDDEKIDIVIANILANPLIELVPVLVSYLKPKGMLVLSGILDSQADEVKKAYAPYIDWLETTVKEGWTRLVGQLR